MTEFDWPSLTHTPNALLSKATVRAMLGQLGPRDSQLRPIVFAFIRLTARAIASYGRARDANAGNNLYEKIDATADLEDCLVCLHRSVCFLMHIRKHGTVAFDGTAILLRENQYSVQRTANRARIEDMRDAILHMDERILEGQIVAGIAIAPTVREGVIELEGVRIELIELVDWLDQVASIADQLATSGAANRTVAV